MADFPEFTDEFTNDMRHVIVGDRVHNGENAVPFSSDVPVGTVCHWSETMVIVRVTEVQWQFMAKV